MKKRLKAAVYDPYLDTLGGGEQYILTILHELEDIGYDVTLFWPQDIQQAIHDKFGIKFSRLNVDSTVFHTATTSWSRWAKLREYDVFIYITDGSYFFSGARKNFVYAMVPRADIYRLSGLNKFKLSGWKFIANSNFTAGYLKKYQIPSVVHYPMLADEFMQRTSHKREKIILSVGRFFGYLHNKNHRQIIASFNVLQQKYKAYEDYRLILAGGVKDEDQSYYDMIRELARPNRSIILMPNVSHEDLVALYRTSMYYWHFAGYGVDENAHPEQVEHLGITPLEAMASGAIVYAYEAGGPREIITDGKNGFLFDSEESLIAKMRLVSKNTELIDSIRSYGYEYIRAHFSRQVFVAHLKTIIQS